MSELPAAVASILTGAPSPLVRRLPVAPLIAGYADQYHYDARPCFDGLDEIGLYECPLSGLRFFWPLSIAGPESLYLCLEQGFGDMYKDEKWEHDISLPRVTPGITVLDVGCGEGSFLARAAAKGAIATGIELNKSAGYKARAKGVEIRAEMLDDHAAERQGHYDIVTNFQVLEHVIDPRGFLDGCVKALKPGGTLIIGVPNDGGFLHFDDEAMLNRPPHHMSLWTRRSLEYVGEMFSLELLTVETEPLAETDWYQGVMERKYLPGGWKRRLYDKLGGGDVLRAAIRENAHTIAGHTIIAVYRKRMT